MKIPPYISDNCIETTLKVAQKIKEKEGISAYLFFKRLAISAMYGELLQEKITYREFIDTVKTHLLYYCNGYKSIYKFWEFNTVRKTSSSKIFRILESTIKYGTQADVEKEIVNNILCADPHDFRQDRYSKLNNAQR